MKVTKISGLLLVIIGVLAVSLVFVFVWSSDLQQIVHTTTTSTATTTITSIISRTEQIGAPNLLQVEGRGLRLTLNYSGLNLKMGDHVNFGYELKNINSPSRLSLLQSHGEIDVEAYNESGTLVWQMTGIYARGPVGPLEESFFKGQSWIGHDRLFVGRNADEPSIKLGPGNYILAVRVKYYNLDLQANEEIGLQTSLKISAE